MKPSIARSTLNLHPQAASGWYNDTQKGVSMPWFTTITLESLEWKYINHSFDMYCTVRKHTITQTHSETNTLCGGSNYVKWLALITFLCLRGDYEHINQQHVCQLEVSKPDRTRDGGEWVKWEVQEWKKTLQGIKLGFSFLQHQNKVYATLGGNRKDGEECNKSSCSNIDGSCFIILSNPHQPSVALSNTCFWTLTHQAEGFLVYLQHIQLSIKELANKRCNDTVSSPFGTIHNTGLTVRCSRNTFDKAW